MFLNLSCNVYNNKPMLNNNEKQVCNKFASIGKFIKLVSMPILNRNKLESIKNTLKKSIVPNYNLKYNKYTGDSKTLIFLNKDTILRLKNNIYEKIQNNQFIVKSTLKICTFSKLFSMVGANDSTSYIDKDLFGDEDDNINDCFNPTIDWISFTLLLIPWFCFAISCCHAFCRNQNNNNNDGGNYYNRAMGYIAKFWFAQIACQVVFSILGLAVHFMNHNDQCVGLDIIIMLIPILLFCCCCCKGLLIIMKKKAESTNFVTILTKRAHIDETEQSQTISYPSNENSKEDLELGNLSHSG